MPANSTEIAKRLWDADDELRANSKLKSSEYWRPYRDELNQLPLAHENWTY
jgi:hypothetical protein